MNRVLRLGSVRGAVMLAVIFFVAGWVMYAWLLSMVSVDASMKLFLGSAEGSPSHRLWTAFAFALLGASVGEGVTLCQHLGRRKVFFVLTLVAMAAVIGWVVFLRYRMAEVGHLFYEVGAVLAEEEALLFAVHDVPLYEVGVFASACVLFCALMLMNRMRRVLRSESVF